MSAGERTAERIPLAAPDLGSEELAALARVLESGRLSQGPETQGFETELAAHVGAARGVALSSGTAGLHLALLALDIGPGDEVITTPFSFVASANAILHVGARPVFVDVDPRTLDLDREAIEPAITERTRAVLAVHLFGRPAPIAGIVELARERGLALIEDACEALGAARDGRAAGAHGDAGVFAFYPNKQITTGEGGMVVTGRAELAERVASLRNHGRAGPSGIDHRELGYNYRMSELAAAIGRVQLARLPAIVERRAAVARAYAERLRGVPGLVLPPGDPPQGRTSWFVYVVRLADEFDADDRDRLAAELARSGIGCGRYFPPIHLLPFYRTGFGYRPGDFPAAEHAAARTLALPFWNQISAAQIDEVAARLAALVGCGPRSTEGRMRCV